MSVACEKDIFRVDIVKAEDVARQFGTTTPKIKAAILNGTLPIGFIGGGAKDRIIIVKQRLDAWINAEDLKGARNL